VDPGRAQAAGSPKLIGTPGLCARHHDTLEPLLVAEEYAGRQIDASFDEPSRTRPFQVELRLLIPVRPRQTLAQAPQQSA
jgi:hypothetical protein